MADQRVVFDYAASIPWVNESELSRRSQELASDDPQAAYRYVRNRRVSQLLDNPHLQSELRDCLSRAGVNVLSVTTPGALSSPEWCQKLTIWLMMFDEIPWLQKLRTPSDLTRCLDNDGIGVILNTQNLGYAMGNDLETIDRMSQAGYRLFQLTYNEQNLLGVGCYARTDGGLSNLGIDAIDRIERTDGVVDLSHCGSRTTIEAAEVARTPVACTHTTCSAVAEHPRGKSDEELEAIAAADGYVGIVLVPWFLAPGQADPSLEVFLDHVEHATTVLGHDRVGLGSDFVNVDVKAPPPYLRVARARASDELGFPEGYGEGYGGGFAQLQTYEEFAVVERALSERFSAREVQGIMGQNFQAFWDRVQTAATSL